MSDLTYHLDDLPRIAAAVLALRSLTQTEAAERLGTSQARISEALKTPTRNTIRIIDELVAGGVHLDGPYYKLVIDENTSDDATESSAKKTAHLLAFLTK